MRDPVKGAPYDNGTDPEASFLHRIPLARLGDLIDSLMAGE